MEREIDDSKWEHSLEEYEEQARRGFRISQQNDWILQEWAKECGEKYEPYIAQLERIGQLESYRRLFAKVGEEL